MLYVVFAAVVVVVAVSVVVFVVGIGVVLVVGFACVGISWQIWVKDNFLRNGPAVISYETQWFCPCRKNDSNFEWCR